MGCWLDPVTAIGASIGVSTVFSVPSGLVRDVCSIDVHIGGYVVESSSSCCSVFVSGFSSPKGELSDASAEIPAD